MSSNMKEKNFISVVVYLRNGEKYLERFLDFVVKQLYDNFEKSELIFVNDASVDNSVQRVRDYMDTNKCNIMTNIVNMSNYHGLESAMLAGEDLSIGDFVYEFDSMIMDYPENIFMELYRTSLLGNDVVAATPKGKTELSAKVFYSLYNHFRINNKDMELKRESFRIISRRAINRVKSLSESVPYRKVMYQNCGLNYKNVEYEPVFENRRIYANDEKTNRTDLAFDTLLMFTNFVQKVSLFLSVVFLVFTLAVGVYTVCVYFSADKPVEGWAPIMGFLAAGFSGIFILFTLLMKYMSVLIGITFNKKQYLVTSVEKITN